MLFDSVRLRTAFEVHEQDVYERSVLGLMGDTVLSSGREGPCSS